MGIERIGSRHNAEKQSQILTGTRKSASTGLCRTQLYPRIHRQVSPHYPEHFLGKSLFLFIVEGNEESDQLHATKVLMFGKRSESPPRFFELFESV